jgi:enoyl-CoA hydratase/carnithine racemase
MDEPVLIEERHGRIQLLRMNRPDARNALSPELITALGLALAAAEADGGIRSVVLTGTGDRAFCAGMDLRAFSEGRQPSDAEAGAMSVFRRFTNGELDIPVLGAANATAVAGGFELLLACDMVVASTTALFGLPEAKRGLFAAGGGVWLAARIPLAVALELNLTGELVDAERARTLGLVNRVVPAEQVLPTALGLADAVAANGPLAIKAIRQMVRASAEDMTAARRLWNEWQPRVFGSNDAREGALAFLERRTPNWTGT